MYNVKTIDKDENYLRNKSKKVLFETDDYIQIIRKLKQFCIERESFAISAVQLGIQKQIIYFYQNEKSIIDKTIINPKIMDVKGKTEYWEACISIPNKIGLVERPYEIEVEYFDINRKKIKETFKGLDATIVAHEIDHLNGVLFIDKAKETKNMTKEERLEFRKKYLYKIISKE